MTVPSLDTYESGVDGPVVVVWPAFGVRARSYRRFAEALCAHGVSVVVVDLRGQGASGPRVTRGVSYGYDDIATEDYPAVLDAVRDRFPGRPYYLLGHSVGGQIGVLHIARQPADWAGLILVAAGTPYFRAYPLFSGLGVLAGTSLIAGIARVVGYWPGDVFRFIGRQPARLMRDWAALARNGRLARSTEDTEALRAATPRVLAVSVAGDRLAPPSAVAALVAQLGDPSVTTLHYRDATGHVGWLRAADGLAALVTRWLAGSTMADLPGGEDHAVPGS
jgi:predicted alpha/beta hydrolase